MLCVLPLVVGCYPKPGGGDMVVTDDHNWSYDVSVDFVSVELTEGADSSIAWSALATDMRGNAVSGPGDTEIVRLLELALTHDQVLEGVAAGTITQQDIISPWEYANAGGADCMMSDLSITGTSFSPSDLELGFVIRGTSSWVASLWRQNDKLGQSEILSSAFLVPSSTSSTTAFAFDDDTATLDFTADLHSGASPVAGAGLDAYTLDWSGVTVDAGGKPFDELKATKLFIAHMAGVASPTDLETTMLTSLNEADTWLLDVYGERTAILSQAASPDDGSFFGGFTAEGVWVVGILDPSGNEPAPYFLTVVTVQ